LHFQSQIAYLPAFAWSVGGSQVVDTALYCDQADGTNPGPGLEELGNMVTSSIL
jgi:hypothetical protein